MLRRFAFFSALSGAALSLGMGALQPALSQTVLDRISTTGRLNTLVMDSDLPYTTKQGNSYVGLGMEFAQEIQKELSDFLGKPVTVTPQPINAVEEGITAIASGQVDLACGVAFSWGRSMFVDYTVPFALSGTRLLTPAGNDGTPQSLSGKTIGVVKSTVAAKAMEKSVPGAKLQSYESPTAALSALKEGKINFLAGDSLWLLANQGAVDPAGKVAPTVPYNRSAVGCIVPENNSALLNLSNLAIARLMQAYINDDPKALARINQWVGPGSKVNLSQNVIKTYFANVLLTTAILALP
jgi:polar amino acid transport system substrate-binding protein